MNWIKFSDKEPPESGLYLIFAPSSDPSSPFIYVAWFEPGFGWSLLPQMWIDAITHWMPLPDPPKGKLVYAHANIRANNE